MPWSLLQRELMPVTKGQGTAPLCMLRCLLLLCSKVSALRGQEIFSASVGGCAFCYLLQMLRDAAHARRLSHIDKKVEQAEMQSLFWDFATAISCCPGSSSSAGFGWVLRKLSGRSSFYLRRVWSFAGRELLYGDWACFEHLRSVFGRESRCGRSWVTAASGHGISFGKTVAVLELRTLKVDESSDRERDEKWMQVYIWKLSEIGELCFISSEILACLHYFQTWICSGLLYCNLMNVHTFFFLVVFLEWGFYGVSSIK